MAGKNLDILRVLNVYSLVFGDMGGVETFSSYKGGVIYLQISLTNSNIFVTGIFDSNITLWGIHSVMRVHTYVGHKYDTNLVSLFPDRKYFGTVSDGFILKLFDKRYYEEVKSFIHVNILSYITYVAFSWSFRIIFLDIISLIASDGVQ